MHGRVYHNGTELYNVHLSNFAVKTYVKNSDLSCTENTGCVIDKTVTILLFIETFVSNFL